MTHLARYVIATVAVLLVSALPLAASGAEEEGAMGAQANMALTKVEGEPYVDHIHASPEAYAAATGTTIDQFFEAPMLAALVAEGKLPPVEERIGQDPQVVRPAFEIGQYGGVLQDAGPDGDDFDAEDFEFFYESILKNEAITRTLPSARAGDCPG